MRKIFLIIIVGLLVSSSCTKRLYYLRDVVADKTLSEAEYEEQDIDYRITKYDILKVNIKSINSEVSSYFNSLYGSSGRNNNQNFGQNNNQQEGGGFYFNGYTVNDSGYIELPIIGNVKVVDKTIPEATKYIQELADEYLENVLVIVKFVSFKVTFIGEVGSPGTVTYFQEKLDIFEAIERAGGISDYGNRQKILVVRKTPEGRRTFYVNMQDRNILASEKLFLLPNDMVYVKPLGWRAFTLSSQDILFALSTITTLLTTTLLILNLSK